MSKALDPTHRGKIERPCQFCGVLFKTWPYLVRQGFGKYCSWSCSSKKHPDGLRECPTCNRVLPATTDYFHRNKSTKTGLHSQCKHCIKDHNAKTRARRIEFIVAKNFTCEGCGLYHSDPLFFEVDHVHPVFKTGAKRRQYKYDDGNEYQLLCPNCHKLKTIADLREWSGYYAKAS